MRIIQEYGTKSRVKVKGYILRGIKGVFCIPFFCVVKWLDKWLDRWLVWWLDRWLSVFVTFCVCVYYVVWFGG